MSACCVLSVWNSLVVFGITDYESCTWPIFTNPVSTESDELGLTCGACSVARLLELVAVAGLLWLWWRYCYAFVNCGGIGFPPISSSIFKRTRAILSTRTPCLLYISTSNDIGDRDRHFATRPTNNNRDRYEDIRVLFFF